MRRMSAIDNIISQADRALRSLTPRTQYVEKISPAESVDAEPMNEADKKVSLGLMRVNHAGEVCAQALYQGQALTAKLDNVRTEMEQAADEEIDHLAWCEQRIRELGGHTSILNPLWYSLSFSLGAAAGLIGDKVSLGFVAATEDQVAKHLNEHLKRLPEHDRKSRSVVSKMLEDEQRHAENARAGGAQAFPTPVKQLMTGTSKVMTTLSYRV